MKSTRFFLLFFIVFVLFFAASCATSEQVNEQIVEDAGPLNLYVNARYRELLNNSMYEISQPRSLRFDTRLRSQRMLLDGQVVPGLLAFVRGDELPIQQMAQLLDISPQALQSVLNKRDASYYLISVGEVPVVAILAGNIDSILLAVERDEELQQLILDVLGKHFRPSP